MRAPDTAARALKPIFVLISESFVGKPLVQRHRAVNACLKDELASGVHALALNTYTPQEWQTRGTQARVSPPCAGSST